MSENVSTDKIVKDLLLDARDIVLKSLPLLDGENEQEIEAYKKAQETVLNYLAYTHFGRISNIEAIQQSTFPSYEEAVKSCDALLSICGQQGDASKIIDQADKLLRKKSNIGMKIDDIDIIPPVSDSEVFASRIIAGKEVEQREKDTKYPSARAIRQKRGSLSGPRDELIDALIKELKNKANPGDDTCLDVYPNYQNFKSHLPSELSERRLLSNCIYIVLTELDDRKRLGLVRAECANSINGSYCRYQHLAGDAIITACKKLGLGNNLVSNISGKNWTERNKKSKQEGAESVAAEELYDFVIENKNNKYSLCNSMLTQALPEHEKQIEFFNEILSGGPPAFYNNIVNLLEDIMPDSSMHDRYAIAVELQEALHVATQRKLGRSDDGFQR